MKMKGKWMILLMILSLAVKIDGGAIEEMMTSLNSLHSNVAKLILEQVKTNKIVDQLQRRIESLEAKNVDYMPMNGTEELDITNSTRVGIISISNLSLLYIEP